MCLKGLIMITEGLLGIERRASPFRCIKKCMICSASLVKPLSLRFKGVRNENKRKNEVLVVIHLLSATQPNGPRITRLVRDGITDKYVSGSRGICSFESRICGSHRALR